MRLPRPLAAGTLALALGVALLGAGAPARAADGTLTWCSEAVRSDPCVSSVRRNGEPVEATDPRWTVSGVVSASSTSRSVEVALRSDGDVELGDEALDDVFVVVLSFAQWTPRVVAGSGREATVRFDGSLPGDLEVEATPVLVSGTCTPAGQAWSCPEEAEAPTDEVRGRLRFSVSNASDVSPSDVRVATQGLHFFGNLAASSPRPELGTDSAGRPVLRVRVGNRHFLEDGSTPVEGHGELRIPLTLLREFLGIPNPGTMTEGSLVARLSGQDDSGYLVVAEEASGAARLVGFDGIGFPSSSSTRTLEVRAGVVTPTRPQSLEATRTDRTVGRLVFEGARARGAKVTGYQARCVSEIGTVRKGNADGSPVRVRRLGRGTAYECRVRARSEAGFGAWSGVDRMPARP